MIKVIYKNMVSLQCMSSYAPPNVTSVKGKNHLLHKDIFINCVLAYVGWNFTYHEPHTSQEYGFSPVCLLQKTSIKHVIEIITHANDCVSVWPVR